MFCLGVHGSPVHWLKTFLYFLRVTNCFLLAVAVEVTKPTVTVHSPVLTVQQGQRAELRCAATGNPAPSIEWTGKVMDKRTVNQL